MADVVDVAARSRMMSGIKGKNTKPELFLRKALHARGFRYVLGGAKLPGKPDLIFPSRQTVVLVHGCFWHCHDCKYFKWPGSNQQFWKDKLEGNRARDQRVIRELKKLGWRVITVWECELKASSYTLPNKAVTRVLKHLASTPI
ncbi:very short patch repair endonuclease [Polaromonas sp. YR568]|uniref:very short patch repair endonuclease n=1 Tax=Polaromonas sp. YR568 TaxID=1855301 RepID=UPI00313823EC